MAKLADRLRASRRRQFVGRAAERELFGLALQPGQPAFSALFVHGPGGVGKSTLLREYAEIARDSGATAVLLDGNEVAADRESFLIGVARAARVDSVEAAVAAAEAAG